MSVNGCYCYEGEGCERCASVWTRARWRVGYLVSKAGQWLGARIDGRF